MNNPTTTTGRRRRRALAGAALALALALVAVACGSDRGLNGKGGATSGGKATKVTVVLDFTPNTNHAGVYLAQANGFYAEQGLDVTIVEPGDSGALGQLAAGNAQFGFSYAEQIVPARAEGTPIVSLAAVIEHNTSSLLAPADRGIRRPKDLEGKTYGGFGGELEKALVDKLVTCDGGDASKVKFKQIGDADIRVGFDRQDYDFVWVFDAWDTIKLRDLGGMNVSTIPFIERTACIPDWYTPVLAAMERTIAKNPALVTKFMAATAKGYRLAMTDPAASAAALAKAAPEADRALLDKSAAYLATRYAANGAVWGRQDAEIWANFATFVRASGMVQTDVDTTKAFTNDFLPK